MTYYSYMQDNPREEPPWESQDVFAEQGSDLFDLQEVDSTFFDPLINPYEEKTIKVKSIKSLDELCNLLPLEELVPESEELEGRLRQDHRQHAGRPAYGSAVRLWSEPDARTGLARLAGVLYLSCARLPYDEAQDGISYTLSVMPQANRQGEEDALTRGTSALDTYFGQGGFHMNLNVLNRDMLLDAMENPVKYPQLTIRVSGYAVNFVRLTREEQQDVVSRTFFHAAI